ncbi:MAG: ABC transporter permease [Bacteroidetes bacterium]|nr:ABC transporter permease [Bacteroidota bacterium]MDA0903412.1 ABC transporter permease [Bacteroidota bacterium]MDA1241556.1 ABC transporter permease [Bacteroidota bacterium]
MLWLRLLRESLSFAWQAIWTNRLRTLLSLLGVMVGIFVISAVFTVVDSLESELRDTFNMLDDDVLFVTKWPWASGGDYPWWKYVQRRPPSERDMELLVPRLSLASAAMFQTKAFLDAEAGNNRMSGVVVGGGSHQYDQVISLNIEHGRYFTPSESAGGSPVAIVGYEIANQLFGKHDAVGETFKIRGVRIEIIGVLAQEGESLVSTGLDEFALVPSAFAPRLYDIRNGDDAQIAIKARPGVELAALEDEIIQQLRAVRRVRPGQEDDFSINRMEMLTSILDSIFSSLAMGGWFIAIFAILVGCFSIANIMFVSVRERTKIIGVQKAIGAKNLFILIQFLFEAVTLCVFGALMALVAIQLLVWIVNAVDVGLTLQIQPARVLLALGVAVTSGLIAGIAPARQASRMPPVEAMRAH